MATIASGGRLVHPPPNFHVDDHAGALSREVLPMVGRTSDDGIDDHASAAMPVLQKKRKRAEKKAKSAQELNQNDTDIAAKGFLPMLESHVDRANSRPVKKLKTAKDAILDDEAVMRDDFQGAISSNGCEPYSLKENIKNKINGGIPQKRKASPTPPPATDIEIQALLNGIANIPSDAWIHPTIGPNYCLIIKWFDHDGLDVHTIADKYGKLVDPKTNRTRELKGAGVEKGIYKHYARYGPLFYEAKGLPWATKRERNMFLTKMKKVKMGSAVYAKEARKEHNAPALKSAAIPGAPLGNTAAGGGHGASKASNSRPASRPDKQKGNAKQKGKAKASTSKPDDQNRRSSSPTETDLDQHVNSLSSKTFTKPRLQIRRRKQKPQPPKDNGPSAEDIARYHQNRNSKDILHFKCAAGDAVLGCPTRPVLDRSCAARHSEPIQRVLEENPGLRIIEYENVPESAVQRFVACISPSLCLSLPTHDIIEVAEHGVPILRAIQIQWTMQELVDLYRFALELGVECVCDMVMDHWFEELHRPTRRTLWNKEGEIEEFDIMDFGPEFLNHLTDRAEVVLEFFVELLVMNKQQGWECWTNMVLLIVTSLRSGSRCLQ